MQIKDLLRRALGRGRFARPRLRTGLSIAVPFSYSVKPELPRSAVVLHIFYPELARELAECCSNIPGRVDLFICTDTPEKAAEISRVFNDWRAGAAVTKVAPNRGRDMLSKFVVFGDAYLDYDLVLFLHSKKSLHLRGGEHDWLTVLTQSLCGTQETAKSIFALFEQDRSLGIVFPQHYEGIREWLDWGDNRKAAGKLASRLGINLRRARALDYPSGSIFWARPAALRPILSLGLDAESFPPEQGQIDGTLAHVLERMILYAAEKAGFSWLKVADPSCYRYHENFIWVHRQEDLPAATRRAQSRLLPRSFLRRPRL